MLQTTTRCPRCNGRLTRSYREEAHCIMCGWRVGSPVVPPGGQQPVEMRRCRVCQQERPVSEFRPGPQGRARLTCRRCERAYYAEYNLRTGRIKSDATAG